MILEDIYDGKIYPLETVVPHGKEYSESKRTISDMMVELEKTLDKEAFEKVTALYNAFCTAEGIEAMEQFKYGFAIGMLLMKEIDDLPYFRK